MLGAFALSAVGALPASAADPVPLTPPFQQPNIHHTLGDFLTSRPFAEKLHIKKTDPLLRPPFAEQPIDTPKGLAAKIRAEELDVKNRVKAIEYLGTVDCRAYPEAQTVLIDALFNDKYEAVRYEAAKSLRNMLSCTDHQQRGAGIIPRRVVGNKLPKKRLPTGYADCPGCCNADVLNALSRVAYEQDEFGCCLEPSLRVREMAVEAMNECCQSCRGRRPVTPAVPTYAEPQPEIDQEIPPAPAIEEAPPTLREEAPPIAPPPQASMVPPAPFPAEQGVPVPASLPTVEPAESMARPIPTPVSFVSASVLAVTAEPCHALNGFCPVSMAEKKLVRASTAYKAVYDGRVYYLSSLEALSAFERAPEKYALGFRGNDPVHFVQTGESEEGILVREYQGTHYSFLNLKNWETFISNPELYLGQIGKDARIVKIGHEIGSNETAVVTAEGR